MRRIEAAEQLVSGGALAAAIEWAVDRLEKLLPLMWSWAGRIQPGTTNDTVVGHIDLYPTLLDLVGVPQPKHQQLDGVSYAAVLRGIGKLDRQAFFNYFLHGQSPGRAGGVTVRSGDWKLIRWFGVPDTDPARLELYNLKTDLGEQHNLAATEG